MGHAVLTIERLDDVLPFYRDLLGFGLSDYILKPFRAFFFHVNPRHHSLAFIETGRTGVHHLMVELFSLDDVGQGYDIALMDKDSIGVTLGRHTNDHVTSFYSRSPSDFMVEYGWGGRPGRAGQMDGGGTHDRPLALGPRPPVAARGQTCRGARHAAEECRRRRALSGRGD